jgi:hypothetical protein
VLPRRKGGCKTEGPRSEVASGTVFLFATSNQVPANTQDDYTLWGTGVDGKEESHV